MMLITDDKRPDLPPADGGDPWRGWKPEWTLKRSKKKSAAPPASPHDLQERHSPTEAVDVRLSGSRTVTRGRQRLLDARLWNALSPGQQDAALDIARAFETMGRGLGFTTSDWTRIPGCRGPSNAAEAHARLISGYIDWTKVCHREKISHAMIIDILVFGFSCKSQDRDRRVRTGTARENLLLGLTLYCRLRGWPAA